MVVLALRRQQTVPHLLVAVAAERAMAVRLMAATAAPVSSSLSGANHAGLG